MQHIHDVSSSHSRSLVLVALLTGCSFALPAPQPDYKPTGAPTCSTSRTAPVGDLVVSGASLLFLYFASVCEKNRRDIDDDPWLDECQGVSTIMLTTGVVAAVAAIAAGRGFQKTSTCRKHWRVHRQCLSGDEQSCAPPASRQEAPSQPRQRPRVSPECQAHKRAIRAAKDPQHRLRLIQQTPSDCLQ